MEAHYDQNHPFTKFIQQICDDIGVQYKPFPVTFSYVGDAKVKIPYESVIEAGCQHLRDLCDAYCLPRGC